MFGRWHTTCKDTYAMLVNLIKGTHFTMCEHKSVSAAAAYVNNL